MTAAAARSTVTGIPKKKRKGKKACMFCGKIMYESDYVYRSAFKKVRFCSCNCSSKAKTGIKSEYTATVQLRC